LDQSVPLVEPDAMVPLLPTVWASVWVSVVGPPEDSCELSVKVEVVVSLPCPVLPALPWLSAAVTVVVTVSVSVSDWESLPVW
jgi:hypothetical protein